MVMSMSKAEEGSLKTRSRMFLPFCVMGKLLKFRSKQY